MGCPGAHCPGCKGGGGGVVALLVVALAVCEAESADCSGQLQALANDGKADAQVCALAELHAASIKVATVAPTTAGAAR